MAKKNKNLPTFKEWKKDNEWWTLYIEYKGRKYFPNGNEDDNDFTFYERNGGETIFSHKSLKHFDHKRVLKVNFDTIYLV